MISVLKIHVMKLRVMILRLSIEIDELRKMICDFNCDCDYDCNFDYPLKRIKGGIDGDNYQTLLMT